MSLHSADDTSLSPDCGVPEAEPRRRSVRRKKSTAELEVSVRVTSVTVSEPFGPGWLFDAAVAPTVPAGSEFSPWRSAYWVIVALSSPLVEDQLTTSG